MMIYLFRKENWIEEQKKTEQIERNGEIGNAIEQRSSEWVFLFVSIFLSIVYIMAWYLDCTVDQHKQVNKSANQKRNNNELTLA